MNIWTIDLETFFSDEFTLKKLTTEAYCRDPRFNVLLLGYRAPDGTCGWVAQEHVPAFLKSVDWSRDAILCHHAHFDLLALTHHYGVRPAMVFDTLSMARAKLGNHVQKSLASLAKYFGLEGKSLDYTLFKNREWANLYPHEKTQVGEGCVRDVQITWELFRQLAQGFPAEELEIISDTIKMFTEPMVYGDTPMLDGIIQHEEDRKRALMMQLNVSDSDLQSSDKFVKLLEELGVDVEWKPSPKPNADGSVKWNPAIAKTDDFMKALLADPDETVSTLAEARLAVRSTIQESRAGRMAAMSRRGPMPVYLSYAAGKTMRFGGSDSMNWQNLPRAKKTTPAHLIIRGAIAAPADHLIVAPDASQIECRIVNWLAGQEDVLDAFRAGRDIYAEAASNFYKTPMTRETHPLERQLFKQVELGCFTADTLVLTDTVPKRIVDVQLTDWLWDGEEWVQHSGVIYQGLRPVINLAGISLTADHRVLCGTNTWREAQSLANDKRLLSLALVKGSENLPSQALKLVYVAGSSLLPSAARAVRPSILLTRSTSEKEAAHGATHAPKNNPAITGRRFLATRTYALLSAIANVCLTASLPASLVAGRARIVIMEPGEFVSILHGLTGGVGGDCFWRTLSLWMGGTIRRSKSIVSTTQKDIGQGIFGLRRDGKTLPTDGLCGNSKQRTPVYDIRLSGPRNRFCVLSDEGPMIAHNCGYGLGAERFAVYARSGSGGPPIYLSPEQSQAAIQFYRDTHPDVVMLWSRARRWLAHLSGGPEILVGPIKICDGYVEGPNGLRMMYPELDWNHGEIEGWSYRTRNGRTRLYGGKLIENITQFLARIVVTQAWLRIKRGSGLRPWLSTHDDLAYIVHKDVAKDANAWMIEEMKRMPEWMPNIPLDAEGEPAERYVK